MKTIGTFSFDILTDMFIRGADVGTAELRAPEIRGVLRWWFRVLGGFKALEGDTREQELSIFGGIVPPKQQGRSGRKDAAIRSDLIVRVTRAPVRKAAKMANDYFLFSLKDKEAGYFPPADDAFEVTVLWNGPEAYIQPLKALITVFGELGSLGMRTRRCMGAIAFAKGTPAPMPLSEALNCFNNPKGIEIKEKVGQYPNAQAIVTDMKDWLRGWRSFGPKENRNTGPGKKYAERDHDFGGEFNESRSIPPYRPALGLPIVQHFSSCRKTITWNFEQNDYSDKKNGRFASPVLLRPKRNKDGSYSALIVFVEAMRWRDEFRVSLKDKRYEVSTDLYDAMRYAPELSPWQER